MRHLFCASCNTIEISVRVVPVVAFCCALFLASCMDSKVADVVLDDEVSTTIRQEDNGVSANLPGPISVRGAIADIMAENGYADEDIKSVSIAGGSYGCLNLEGDHDWTVSGRIEARRTDGGVAGPLVTLLDYSNVSVESLLDRREPAPLTPEGVDLIHEALRDYLDGGSPVIEFQVGSSSASPSPSAVDPMVFDWKVWLDVQIVVEYEVRVPDPF